MKSLKREDLAPLGKNLDELLKFIYGLEVQEIPYFFRYIENMKYNLEICVFVRYDGWEQIELLLKRDWGLANDTLIGISSFRISAKSPLEKSRLEYEFIMRVANVEKYFK